MLRAKVRQRALLTLCVFALVQLIASVVYAHVIDGYGDVDTTNVRPFVVRVDRVDPQSPLSRDGLRAGDMIDLKAMSPSDRQDWDSYLKVGRRYALPIVRAGSSRVVRIDMNRNIADSPFWRAIRWQFYVGFAGIFVMLVVAGVLLFARPESADVALLSATLVFIALGQDFGHFGAWDTMNDASTAGGYAVSEALRNLGLVLLATYALRFAAPPSKTRRALTNAAYAVALLGGLAAAWMRIGYWRGVVDPSFGFFASLAYGSFADGLPFALPLACALLAIRDARGAERSRVAWATGALSILYVAPLAFYVFGLAGADWPIDAAIMNLSFPLAAIGLSYALLGHRLLDVGFALNRAAVFAAVSLVVVGAFSLVEWALGGWLASASRSTNVTVSALLALALGLAIHPIHTLTDRFVDNVFFRKRHEAERALRAFSKEAAFISDPALVVERTIAILRDRTDCTWANVLTYDGERTYGGIDENDPALVTLRATRDVVSLRGLETSVRGEYCFPMSAGGRLLGALVVGPKQLGESFAPDERDAIASVAHGVGVALALLAAEAPRGTPAVSDSIAVLVDAIEALPEALARTLNGDTSFVPSKRSRT